MKKREKKKEYRYAICKDCREKWNIALHQDTTPFYRCPRCAGKNRRRKA